MCHGLTPRLLFLAAAGLIASCAAPVVDVCAGQAAGCLVLGLSGGPGGIDALRIISTEAGGNSSAHTDEWQPGPVWPAQVPLVLANGSYHLTGLGFQKGALIAVARGEVTVTGNPGSAMLVFASYPGPACNDQMLNGDESDVDCGGSCPPCAIDRRCAADRDCGAAMSGPVCLAGRCAAPGCHDGRRDGDESDMDCGGSCPVCADGGACLTDHDCKSSRCAAGVCRPLDCFDGKKDGAETDSDCGGPACSACAEGLGCFVAGDCNSGVCTAGSCAAPSCGDHLKNGSETDIDCGGSCPRCGAGAACAANLDCKSLVCSKSRCAPASCGDGQKNGAETDVDCGGACPACADGKHCGNAVDCQSLVCAAGQCAAASCLDRVHNGGETDVDCGGKICPACVTGAVCGNGGDCKSLVCTKGRCDVASCSDQIRNGDESDVDCGGACPACGDGRKCSKVADCASGVCGNGTCLMPSCMDGVKNGAETDVDCGGNCPVCVDGKRCLAAGDCKSAVCGGGLCRVARCGDQVKNGGETDVDCGGPCGPCGNGAACALAGDCQSGVCGNGACRAPACNDKIRNGSESDVDCGGSCGPCGDGKACIAIADCASMRCEKGACRSCMDGLKSGGETDVDCGGACPACADLKACIQPGDCQHGSCAMGLCRSCSDGVQNGDETDVDCGGSCGPCGDTRGCAKNLDCQSGRCAAGHCASCVDGQKDDLETDIDCGGGVCPVCADTRACAVAADCLSHRCDGGRCASCKDNVQSGTESDVDCGGVCAACALGRRCNVIQDCLNGQCFASTCVPPMIITSVSPSFGVSGQTTNITVNGSSFDPKATVTVNGVPGTNVVWISQAQLTVTTPVLMGAFGKTPLVVTNPSTQKAQGTFHEQAQTIKFQSFVPSGALPAKPTAMVRGDFNGDNKADLAVALGPSNQVAILIGKGDGTFAAPLLFATGANPLAIAAGDLNGDGWLDVVTADNGGITVSALLGDGAGNLGAAMARTLPAATSLIALGDMNNDKKLDVVTANPGIVIALGNANGTFAAPTTVSNNRPGWIKLLDQNHDGFSDVVSGYGSNIGTLPGKGNGTFGAEILSQSSGGNFALLGPDLDGDSLPDIVAAGTPTLLSFLPYRFMHGNFNGTFSNPVDMRTGTCGDLQLRTFDIADLNNDGRPELVLFGSTAEIAWAQGSAANFNQGQGFIGAGAPAIDHVFYDWDGDGKIDLMTLSNSPSRVNFIGGNGDLTFRAPVALDISSGADVAVADFDGDGVVDLAQSGGATLVYLSRKSGYLNPSFSYANPQWVTGNTILAGILTPGGLNDFVVPDLGNFLATGNGLFQVPIAPVPSGVGTLGDFDGDGALDYLYLIGGLNNPLSFLHGRGIGTFLAGVNPGVMNFPDATQMASADFDGDGKTDVVSDDRLNGGWAVYLGNGNGTLRPGATVAVGAQPLGVTVLDVDQDGKPDLVGAIDAAKTLAVALGNGDGTFRVLAPVPLPTTPASRLGAGDLDGDGRPDLLVGTTGNSALVLLNKGAGLFAVALEVPVGPAFQRAAIVDLSGDGKPDLVLAGASSASYVLPNLSQ